MFFSYIHVLGFLKQDFSETRFFSLTIFIETFFFFSIIYYWFFIPRLRIFFSSHNFRTFFFFAYIITKFYSQKYIFFETFFLLLLFDQLWTSQHWKTKSDKVITKWSTRNEKEVDLFNLDTTINDLLAEGTGYSDYESTLEGSANYQQRNAGNS